MPLHNITVLAVDDNEAHRYALCRTLQSFGANVLSAGSGAEALRLAHDHPDIVLLDVNLPDSNGFDVCRQLKADQATAMIPVVFITQTFQSTSAANIADSVGAEMILFHPVTKQQLLAVVQGQTTKAARANRPH